MTNDNEQTNIQKKRLTKLTTDQTAAASSARWCRLRARWGPGARPAWWRSPRPPSRTSPWSSGAGGCPSCSGALWRPSASPPLSASRPRTIPTAAEQAKLNNKPPGVVVVSVISSIGGHHGHRRRRCLGFEVVVVVEVEAEVVEETASLLHYLAVAVAAPFLLRWSRKRCPCPPPPPPPATPPVAMAAEAAAGR